MNVKKAPIALFVYKRPVHLEKTLEALSRCAGAAESELFIYSDGPKKEGDRPAVEEVRRLIRKSRWAGKAHIIERDKNLGLAGSIIAGVTELCERYGRVIVLEDDLIVSKYFLEYMNSALGRYKNEERVMQISGHMFPVDLKEKTDAVFLPITTSWGWATWARAWKSFDGDMKDYRLIEEDRALRRRFDLDGSYSLFDMLKGQKEGRLDSWAIRWYLSVFMQGGLVLFPARSLVENFGFDSSGSHCKSNSPEKGFSGALADFSVRHFPSRVEASTVAFEQIKRFLSASRTQGPLNIFIRLWCQLRDTISKAV